METTAESYKVQQSFDGGQTWGYASYEYPTIDKALDVMRRFYFENKVECRVVRIIRVTYMDEMEGTLDWPEIERKSVEIRG